MKQTVAVGSVVHDDHAFMSLVLEAFPANIPRYVFISKVPWSGEVGDWETAVEICKACNAEAVIGEWSNESDHRRAAYEYLKNLGFEFVIIPDTDEILEPELIENLLKIAKAKIADRVHVTMETYWKSAEFRVRAADHRRPLLPIMMINLKTVEHVYIREFQGGKLLVLGEDFGIMHHLSYVGSDERIHKKVNSWSHKDEVVPGWYQKVWLGWDVNPFKTDLHPTHPWAYHVAERVPIPEILRSIPGALELTQIDAPLSEVSVVIPVYGAAEDLRICLEHLATFAHELKEVIVVDNASPDHALEVAKSFPFVKVIENPENEGFARGCNAGYEASTGQEVLFLNSDAYAPEIAFRAMVQSLYQSGSIAAVGPYSNNVGHEQRIDVTYSSVEHMPLFADTFAGLERQDRDMDMLVGFCLLIRRSILEEVGAFDTGFGLGLFEDNDLCYRIRRAGYRLVASGKAFVHHEGSKTINSAIPQANALFLENHAKYLRKWKHDLEMGFVNTLSGLSAEKLHFNDQRRPETLAKEHHHLAKKARISLCMIVRDEERVIRDCLTSAMPYFYETIVVDTGSTDHTREIAEECGAKVFDFPWQDSFSAARNESIRHATGDWIMWMDADDTLPMSSGAAILQAVLSAPAQIHGFVVPVQFVDDGTNSGTRVDHVKLFRRLPGVEFSLRIHEQILPSLTQHGGQIARCEAVVMHSGYDTSEEGQKKKRERDSKLLKLDLEENPDHPFVLFNLGMTEHFLGNHENACMWLQKSIDVSSGSESHLRKAYSLKGVSTRLLVSPQAAVRVFEAGLKAVGWDAELWFHLGVTQSQMGNIDQAIAAYQNALSQKSDGFYSSVDVAIQGHKTLFNLGALFQQKGDCSQARTTWHKALEMTPTFTPSAFALFDAAIAEGDRHTAESMLSHVYRIERESQNWLAMQNKFVERFSLVR